MCQLGSHDVCVCGARGTLRNDNELNHYYTKVHTVILVGLPETADIAAITEKCEVFGAVFNVRRPEVRKKKRRVSSQTRTPPTTNKTEKKIRKNKKKP